MIILYPEITIKGCPLDYSWDNEIDFDECRTCPYFNGLFNDSLECTYHDINYPEDDIYVCRNK